MFDRVTPAHGLVVLGLVLLLAPALVPVQQYRIHDTRAGTFADRSDLEQQGFTIVAYENLSDRGQELYRKTLRHGGHYTVPIGQGASDFEYGDGTTDEPSDVRGPGSRPGVIVIERPPNASLPPADEPVEAADRMREREQERRKKRRTASDTDSANGTATPTTPDYEARRRSIARYDIMETSTDTPPITDSSNLIRLLAALVGVLCLGVGGYRASKP